MATELAAQEGNKSEYFEDKIQNWREHTINDAHAEVKKLQEAVKKASKVPIVYYGTRTHRQIKQIIKVLWLLFLFCLIF